MIITYPPRCGTITGGNEVDRLHPIEAEASQGTLLIYEYQSTVLTGGSMPRSYDLCSGLAKR